MSIIEDAAKGRLTPPAAPTFKLFTVGDWQALVRIVEDENSDTRWLVKVTIPCLEVDVELSFGAPNEEIARKIFDGMRDGEKIISGAIKSAFGETEEEQQA
jgi:hypothetical protein